MAVVFQGPSFAVPGGFGTKLIDQTIFFNGVVTSAEIALKGFEFHFEDFDDHPLRVVEAKSFIIQIVPSGLSSVRFGVVCQFGDSNLDDPYTGSVDVLVIANVL
jgi:hypothetical protein